MPTHDFDPKIADKRSTSIKAMWRDHRNYSCRKDVTTEVKNACNNLTSCNVPHKSNELGEPCKGKEKELYVEWNCEF